MPKIIEQPRERILAAARSKLFEDGYAGLSLRGIAGECGIAVGTIYNYFQDKDTLVASVMMEDWLCALDEMKAGCDAAGTASDGFAAVYGAIRKFEKLYESVWDQFFRAGGSPDVVSSRHGMLRGQIARQLEALLERLGKEDAALAPLLAETVLSAAMQPDIGPEQIRALAARLL